VGQPTAVAKPGACFRLALTNMSPERLAGDFQVDGHCLSGTCTYISSGETLRAGVWPGDVPLRFMALAAAQDKDDGKVLPEQLGKVTT
jgi:hypothetical protein